MARSANQAAATALRTDAKTPKVRWETSNLKSSYANVCSVSSTREEVIFNFGVNKAWERGADEVEVELTDRLILSWARIKVLLPVLLLGRRRMHEIGPARDELPG